MAKCLIQAPAILPPRAVQDVRGAIVATARDAYSPTADSRTLVWGWLEQHWDDVHKKLGGASGLGALWPFRVREWAHTQENEKRLC